MQWIDSLRDSWEKLSDRERRLLSISSGVFGAVLIFVAVWTTSSAVAEVEEERDDIRKVLADIDRAADSLQKRAAERAAVEARFRNKAPALAAFVEGKAKEQGLEVRQVLEEPQKDVNGYRRQSVRVSFQGASLRPVVRLLTSISEENLPIAVDRIHVQHYAAGDSYKVDIGIVGFDPPKGKAPAVGGSAAAQPAAAEESP